MRARTAALTYAEVGATRGPLPAGYHHLERSRAIGRGRPAFERAAERVMAWDVQRGAGLRVESEAPTASAGADVTVCLGPGRWAVRAPCRVVYTVESPTTRGFAYGTLDGHAESGEELFVVTLDADGTVTLSVRAFSRPATWLTRLTGPGTRLVQRLVTHRYLHALDGD